MDLDTLIAQVAQEKGVDPKIFRRLVYAESSGNPNAVSPAGAQGLTQLMPATAKELGVVDPFDPKQNLEGGATYLKNNLDKFGSYPLAVAAHNAGPGAIQKYGGIPPYKETQNYTNKIMNGPEPAPKQEKTTTPNDLLARLNKTASPTSETAKSTTPMDLVSRLNGGNISTTPNPQAQPTSVPAQPDVPIAAVQTPPPENNAFNSIFDQVLARVSGVKRGLGLDALANSSVGKSIDEGINNLIGPENAKKKELYSLVFSTLLKNAENRNPGAATMGELGGFAVGPGKAIGLATAPLEAVATTGELGKILTTLVKGGVEGAGYEGVTDPNATPDKIAKAGGLGVLSGGALLGLGKSASLGSEKLMNSVIGAKLGSNAGKFINEKLGPVLTRAGITNKTERALVTTEAELQAVLKSHADVSVDMRKIVQNPNVIKIIEGLDNVESRGQATKLLARLAKLEQRGALSVSDANILKRDMYNQAYTATSDKKTVLGKFYKNLAGSLREAIETATGDPRVKTLNKTLADGMEVQKVMRRLDNAGPLLNAVKTAKKAASAGAGYAVAGPVGAAATTAAQTIPGASLLNAVGSKALQNPEIIKIISQLMSKSVK